MILTNNSGKTEVIYAAEETFTKPVKRKQPALVKVSLNPGETKEITNSNKDNLSITAGNYQYNFEYAKYDANRKVVSYGTIVYDTNVEAGERIVITNKTGKEEVSYAAEETFPALASKEKPELVKVLFTPGATNEIVNESKDLLTLTVGNYAYDLECAIFKNGNEAVDYGNFSYSEEVKAGNRIVLTNRSNKGVVLYTAEENSIHSVPGKNPALTNIVLHPGEEISYIHEKSDNLNIKTKRYEGLLTSFYDREGNVVGNNSTNVSWEIKKGYGVRLVNQRNNNVELYGPADSFDVYKFFDTKSGVAIDKAWKVKFSKKLDAASLQSSKIFVMDVNSKKLMNNKVKLLDDGYTVEVAAPTFNYEKGKLYTLYIQGDLRSIDGKKLSSPSEMTFYIDR